MHFFGVLSSPSNNCYCIHFLVLWDLMSDPLYSTMPKHDQTFQCFCELCQAGPLSLDGEPLGVVFPISQHVAHLACVKDKHETLIASSSPLPADLDAAIFAQAIINMGPCLNSHASCLWTSWNDYQCNKVLSSGGSNIFEYDILNQVIGQLQQLPHNHKHGIIMLCSWSHLFYNHFQVS